MQLIVDERDRERWRASERAVPAAHRAEAAAESERTPDPDAD